MADQHLFMFYVDENSWPIMRNKKNAINAHWLPRNQPRIRLWKEDVNGGLLIPSGVPKPVTFKRLWGGEEPSKCCNQVKAKEKAAKALDKKSMIQCGIQTYTAF